MKVIGAGYGRTGTYSLKLGLERLLGKPCYHMANVFENLETDVPVWHAAAKGEKISWREFMSPYGAAVDLPVSMFWRELSEEFPDATIVLSVRDADSWWESVQATIHNGIDQPPPPPLVAWKEMVVELIAGRFTPHVGDEAACKAAYIRHNETVMREADPKRLVVWHARDGWEPLCRALELPVPDEPFPKANTREEFIGRRMSQSGDDPRS